MLGDIPTVGAVLEGRDAFFVQFVVFVDEVIL